MSTQAFIEKLAEKHSNAIPIFGGALWINSADMDAIIDYLPNIIRSAQFWKWHAGVADACRMFCHCLFVDPALVEVCIGATFDEIARRVTYAHA
jgi:hypothetical protein